MQRAFRWRPSKTQVRYARIGLAILGIFIVLVYISLYVSWPRWTGFDARLKNEAYESSEKTLWDWMDLLLVPLVLAVGGYFYQRLEKRTEQDRVAEREKTARDLAEDDQREAALQTYLDRMSDLLIDKQLGTANKGSAEQAVARARTLTVLTRLDSARKGQVIRFLYESSLITSKESPLLEGANLEGANLRGANLRGANLEDANLCWTKLMGANLRGANLWRASLRLVNLEGANLIRANLTGADLAGANLAEVSLGQNTLALAKFDRETVLPKGFKPEAGGAMPGEPGP